MECSFSRASDLSDCTAAGRRLNADALLCSRTLAESGTPYKRGKKNERKANLQPAETFRFPGGTGSKVAVEDDRMRSSEAVLLAVAAAILAVVAVVLYSLVAQKMYAKDREVAKLHQKPGTHEPKPGEPK